MFQNSKYNRTHNKYKYNKTANGASIKLLELFKTVF